MHELPGSNHINIERDLANDIVSEEILNKFTNIDRK